LEIVVQVTLPSFALPSTYAKASCLALKIAWLFPGSLYRSLNRRILVPCLIVRRAEDVLSELRENYALNSSVDGCVGEDLGVPVQVGEIAQSENEGFVAAKGVDECLVRGEIHLDLTEVARRWDLGLGSVTSEGCDVELGRSNERVEYLLAEGACGLFKSPLESGD